MSCTELDELTSVFGDSILSGRLVVHEVGIRFDFLFECSISLHALETRYRKSAECNFWGSEITKTEKSSKNGVELVTGKERCGAVRIATSRHWVRWLVLDFLSTLLMV